MWTPPPLWTAQNAPTGVWKSRKEREIPTAPTSIIFVFDEEKERRTKTTQTNCPPNRVTPKMTAEQCRGRRFAGAGHSTRTSMVGALPSTGPLTFRCCVNDSVLPCTLKAYTSYAPAFITTGILATIGRMVRRFPSTS
jgi:hypothetical protein